MLDLIKLIGHAVLENQWFFSFIFLFVTVLIVVFRFRHVRIRHKFKGNEIVIEADNYDVPKKVELPKSNPPRRKLPTVTTDDPKPRELRD